MIGPLSVNTDDIHCGPIELVPKGRDTWLWRMIDDLSHPERRCVNDGVAPPQCSLQFLSVEDALRFIMTLSHGTCLIKVD